MGGEDTKAVCERKPLRAPAGTFINVHPQPEGRAEFNSNAEGQLRNPELYVPYADEGEVTQLPRTPENVAALFEKLGLTSEKRPDIPPDKLKALQEVFYDHWLCFDGKMREIKGVKVDLDKELLRVLD